MAFNTSKTNTSKNQFLINFISRKSGKVASWINPTSTFITSLTGKDMKEVSAVELRQAVGNYYDNDNLYADIVDITAEITTISASEF